jgi:hypothetical protein
MCSAHDAAARVLCCSACFATVLRDGCEGECWGVTKLSVECSFKIEVDHNNANSADCCNRVL